MTDEERLLKQFEPACLRYTANLNFPGMDQSDLQQEARLAALYAIRAHALSDKKCKLSTYVITAIKWRVNRLFLHFSQGIRDKRMEGPSLDDKLSQSGEDEYDLYVDTLKAPDVQSSRDLLSSCLSLCKRSVEGAIIMAIWDDRTLAEVAREAGLSKERVRQIKDRLMLRLREEVMTNGGA